MESKPLLHLNAGIFALVALLHILRLILGLEATIGDWDIPLWASVLGIIVGGFLAYLNWSQAKKVYF